MGRKSLTARWPSPLHHCWLPGPQRSPVFGSSSASRCDKVPAGTRPGSRSLNLSRCRFRQAALPETSVHNAVQPVTSARGTCSGERSACDTLVELQTGWASGDVNRHSSRHA
jgi:hypothetical protein